MKRGRAKVYCPGCRRVVVSKPIDGANLFIIADRDCDRCVYRSASTTATLSAAPGQPHHRSRQGIGWDGATGIEPPGAADFRT